MLTINQDRFAPLYPTLRILAIYGPYGALGNTVLGSNVGADAYASGLRGILTNVSNFGPSGKVQAAGVSITQIANSSANSLTSLYLSQFDVLYIVVMR